MGCQHITVIIGHVSLLALFTFTPSLSPRVDATDEVSGIVIRESSVISIVTPTDATAKEISAAKELSNYLERMSGGKTETIPWSDILKEQKGLIIVGRVATVAGGFTEAEIVETGLDGGYRVRTRNGNVYIAGGAYGGTVNGVYWFLEQLGAKFYSLDLVVLPESKPLDVPVLDVLRKPSFDLRMIKMDGDSRLGDNLPFVGDPASVEPELKKKWGYISWEHTSQFLVPVDYYGKEHPEYYAQTEDGSFLATEWLSKPHPGQIPWSLHLCLSNPNVREIAKERLLKWIDTQPERRFFNVTQMDGYDWCQCPECRALDTVPGKVMTDRLLDFINDIARTVRTKYPDKIIMTYAYTDRTGPVATRLKPESNVRVFICPYTPEVQDQGHWLTHKRNCAFMPWYDAWRRYCPGQIYIYEYPLVSSLYLSFVHESYYERIKNYARDGIRGMYFCGRSTYMNSLFKYVTARLAWDSSLDPKPLVTDFITAYYGPAASKVQDIYSYLSKIAVGDDRLQGTTIDMRKFISSEECEQLLLLYEEAEALAKDSPMHLARVQEDKSFVIFTDLMKHNPVQRTVKDPALFKRRIAELFAIAQRPGTMHGFGHYLSKKPTWIKEWFLRIARLKITQDKILEDPLVKQLLTDPDSVKLPEVPTVNPLELLPNGAGWRVPLDSFEECIGPAEYGWECPKRNAIWIRTKGSDYPRMRAKLLFEKVPGPSTLTIDGQDDDKPGSTRILISINGKELFRGENGFVEKGWSTRSFEVPEGLLKAGENELLIENIEEGNNIFAQWFMLADARIELKKMTFDKINALLLSHFDTGLDADCSANPEATVKGGFKISPEGKWGGALDAGYSENSSGSMYYCGLDNYRPERGTADMWVKLAWDPRTNKDYHVFLNIMGPSAGQRSGLLLFRYTTDNPLNFHTYADADGLKVSSISASIENWTPGSWHHIAVTWDARIRVVQIFLDGVLAARGTAVFLGTDVADRVNVGCQFGSGFIANALIDELRITDSVLWEGNALGEKVFDVPEAPYQDKEATDNAKK